MAELGELRRGDCVFVENNHAVGAEIRKSRKAIVVSNKECCRYNRVVQVVYLTRGSKKDAPYHVRLNDGRTAMCEQIYTVDLSRIEWCGPRLSPKEMDKISEALAFQLGLKEAEDVRLETVEDKSVPSMRKRNIFPRRRSLGLQKKYKASRQKGCVHA